MTNRQLPIASVVAFSLIALVACSRNSAESERVSETGPTIGWGTAMADVGRRFELLGRAALAGRYELAEYELGEVEELFEEVLPHATPPKEGHPEVLPARVAAFSGSTLAGLRRGLTAHDPAQFQAAFQTTAEVCNACHQASGHGFIQVPARPGHGIPNLDPLSATTP